MGNAFDSTGDYGPFLLRLSALTMVAAGLMFLLPAYDKCGLARLEPLAQPEAVLCSVDRALIVL